MVTVAADDYAQWRRTARRLLADGTPPDRVAWVASSPDALPLGPLETNEPPATVQRATRVARAFLDLADLVSLHRSERKWELLYRLLWRVSQQGSRVLDDECDDDVRMAKHMAAQVRRDEHRMRAFLRFTRVIDERRDRFVAWYEPDHLIVRRASPFFADRFAAMKWSILTPDLAAHWDGTALTFSAGMAERPRLSGERDIEALWRTYYQATFNPARVNQRAMQQHMPRRRWRELPEAAVIPDLVNRAVRQPQLPLGQDTGVLTARPFIPVAAALDDLRAAVQGCGGCRLRHAATQAVFGEGPSHARVVVVGEQPGDEEDRSGRPFVGPAGQVLDRAFAAAGLDRREIYVTNAVKHFSFEPRGKRRIHQTPRLSEILACRPWLEAELQRIRPGIVVAMGSTAARALLGPQARVMSLRGRILEGLAWAPRVIVTLHPSAVLRAQDRADEYFHLLAGDLALARAACDGVVDQREL